MEGVQTLVDHPRIPSFTAQGYVPMRPNSRCGVTAREITVGPVCLHSIAEPRYIIL